MPHLIDTRSHRLDAQLRAAGLPVLFVAQVGPALFRPNYSRTLTTVEKTLEMKIMGEFDSSDREMRPFDEIVADVTALSEEDKRYLSDCMRASYLLEHPSFAVRFGKIETDRPVDRSKPPG